ncbi:MAG: hypothetical protein CL833_05945 [Crocinitomicaceae bacterium]|nr:hypothetical protein [Crocinitomicaceae bacterium]|tara:strand:- start:1060 stop:1623 length:564 start_codon:yes stop_codon:yes gene_type:complete
MKNFKTVKQSPLGQTNTFEESNEAEIKIPSSRPFFFQGAIIGRGQNPYTPGAGVFLNFDKDDIQGQIVNMFSVKYSGGFFNLIELEAGFFYELEAFVSIDYASVATTGINLNLNFQWEKEDGTQLGLEGSSKLAIANDFSVFDAGRIPAQAIFKAKEKTKVGIKLLSGLSQGRITFRDFKIKSLGKI